MEENNKKNVAHAYIPTADEQTALEDIFQCYSNGREIIEKNYNQFNGRSLKEAIDDWEKRWNGYIPASNPLVDSQSKIFLNFTRNAIISYISKTGEQPAKAKIQAVKKRIGQVDKKFSKFCEDVVKYSQDEENGDSKYQEVNLERTIKGTAIVYEGYARNVQKMKIPDGFDMQTGKGKFKEEKRIVFDNCFQKLVKVNHFLIKNPYLSASRLQEQPWIIHEEITTYDEAKNEFGKYKNWDYVLKGNVTFPGMTRTFYENQMVVDLQEDQVQILRLYKRSENVLRIVVNGVIMYDGAIPFKDGRYPYAVYIFEPFGNDFFWGAGFPNKIMGEQDSINTQFNLMTDKQINSLLPYGLSSDLDDLIEDDILEPNKIRKVSDINKWKFDTLPGIMGGEANFLQQTLSFARQNAGDTEGLGNTATPKGGAVTARQVLIKQQEAMQRMEFSMGYMEDGERDRTILRLNHILQFYSIPKLSKVTGDDQQEMQNLVYREIKMPEAQLSDGQQGTLSMQLINGDAVKTPDQLQSLQDQLSLTEALGEQNGTPTEALAINVDTFYDHNCSVQVVRNSSFTKNQALDQAMKHEFADWMMTLVPFGMQVDVKKLAEWVGESYDVEVDDFLAQQQVQPQPQQPGMPPQGQPQIGGPAQALGPKQMKQPAVSAMMG